MNKVISRTESNFGNILVRSFFCRLMANCCDYVQERHGIARQSAFVARRNQTNVTTPAACKMTAPAFNEIKNSSSAGRFWGEALAAHFRMRCVARKLWLYVLLTVKKSRYYAVKRGRPRGHHEFESKNIRRATPFANSSSASRRHVMRRE